jgi:hypothetical protein
MPDGILDKLWTVASIVLTGLLSFFMYHIKKTNEEVEEVKDSQSSIRCEQATHKIILINIQDDIGELKVAIKELINQTKIAKKK